MLWNVMETGRIFGLCDHRSSCLIRDGAKLQEFSFLTCISSISYVYKGLKAPQLKEQCELSCLLQQLSGL